MLSSILLVLEYWIVLIEREIKHLPKESIELVVGSGVRNYHSKTISKQLLKLNLLNGFLPSVGKYRSHATQEFTKLSINNELSVYRSLAMQEFADILEHSKDHDPFGFWY